MKRWLSITLLLLISFPFNGFSCYFYPYGEDIRMSIFSPDNFDYNLYRMYNYTTTWFYEGNYVTNLNSVTENDLMWYRHCHKMVPIQEIKKAVFEEEYSTINLDSKNQFIQYLYRHKDFQTISYLLFAKEIEKLNPTADDIWEKANTVDNKLRNKKIEEGFKRIQSIDNIILKKRYYFQIFKLLSYMDEKERIIKLYDIYAKLFKTKDFLDNWVLFYRMSSEKDNVKMNYLAAQVFERGTDNKFDVKWYFNRSIPMERVLKFAKTDEEKANIHVLYSFKKVDQNLENIQKAYQYNKNSKGLGFLLLREINKIEDWILTPTYTMYMPSLRQDYWENSNGKRILDRAEVDRQYAFKVLEFVNSADLNKVDSKEFWLVSKAYLQFLTKQYPNSLETIHSLEDRIKDPKIKNQCRIIKAMALTANQQINTATIPKSIEGLLVEENAKRNYRFIFAVARELEILNNKVDAAFLISKMKADEFYNSRVFWKSPSGKITLYDDFFYDWYGYVDAELSTIDLQNLVNVVHSGGLSEFDKWKIYDLSKERNKINDLMGIKYMRDDNLRKAQLYFSKVDQNHYTNAPLFNENPFYKIKGYMNFDAKKSTAGLTKSAIVNSLIGLIDKAGNAKNKNRNKDYFLVGNCYYNMTYYGNSWMMKRICWSENRDANYNDESDYYQCNKAKSYYQKAMDNSKSRQFKALCMYMISKCDARNNEYLLMRQYGRHYYVSYEKLDKENEKAFVAIQAKYPDDFADFTSNCEIFSKYFKNWK